MRTNIASLSILLLSIIGINIHAQQTKNQRVEVGSKIPDFTLKDDSGKDFNISN